jgi:hypothetical protein
VDSKVDVGDVKKRKISFLYRESNHDTFGRTSHSLVVTPTELSRATNPSYEHFDMNY